MKYSGKKVLVMGLAFKENCPDIRNTRVVDIVRELNEYNCEVEIYDPWVSVGEAQHEYGLTPIATPEQGVYDAIILAVAHRQFKEMGSKAIRGFGKSSCVLFDLKYALLPGEADLRL